MPRHTESIGIADALDAVENDLDGVADRIVGLEADIDEHGGADDAPAALVEKYRDAAARGDTLETHRVGLAWALDPDDDRDPITEVTVGALTAGEAATVADRTASMSQLKADDWGVQDAVLDGANKNEYAAIGLVEAPFIDADDEHADVVGKLADCAPEFVSWLAERVDEVSTPDVEGNGFAERVANRRRTRSDTSTTAEQS